MKFIIKLFIGFHVFMYRITGGKFGGEMGKFKVLILTTKGRKFGKILSAPLGYFERDGGYIIVASNNGCLLYKSDAADARSSGDLGGRRIIKKKNKTHTT